MQKLDGAWYYESFRPLDETAAAAPQLARWSPPRGQLNVTTDPETGRVSGTLQFAPGVELAISGRITPSEGPLPEGVELTGQRGPSISRLRGFFVDGETVTVVGSVLAAAKDLAGQPDGTRGPFILFRASTDGGDASGN